METESRRKLSDLGVLLSLLPIHGLEMVEQGTEWTPASLNGSLDAIEHALEAYVTARLNEFLENDVLLRVQSVINDHSRSMIKRLQDM